MAALIPEKQQFLDLRDGTTMSITTVKLVSTSDTITLPVFADADTSNSASCRQLYKTASDATITLTTSTGADNVTIVGVAGNRCTIAGLHKSGNYMQRA